MTARWATFVLCLALTAACGSRKGNDTPVEEPPGRGNWEVMKPLAGRFPLVELNGDGTVTGFLDVKVGEEGVSLSTETLKMASNPAPVLIWNGERSATAWQKDGDRIVQTTSALKVTYDLGDGFFGVTVEDCTKGSCATSSMIASQGKVPGEAWTARDFFKVFKGRYTIQTAGGAAPHEGANELMVDPDADPAPEIQAPFCTTSCDAGDNYLPFDKTQVFRRQLSPDHAIYWVMTDSKFYTWDARGNEITWRNLQYKVNKQPVVLEHVVKYAGPIPPP